MPLTLTCRCGKLLDIDAAARGKPAQCPACGNVFVAGAPISTTTAIRDGEPDAKRAEPANPNTEIGEAPSIEKPWVLPPSMYWALLIVFLFVGGVGLWACVWPEIIKFDDFGPADIAKTQGKSLSVACDQFRIKNNRWPKDLEELLVRDVNGFVYIEDPHALKDPWGKPYQYDPNGPKNNGRHADIWAVAPDGQTIGNWPQPRNGP